MIEIQEYVKQIKFRFVQPHSVVPAERLTGSDRLLEFANTIIPEDEEYMRQTITPIWSTPKMSTFAIGAIINRMVLQMPKDQVYVNVGVWNGYSFLAGMVNNPHKTCIGIDNFSQFKGPRAAFMQRFFQFKSPNHHFFDMDYIQYFKDMHNYPIGCYFFDGPHDYGNQLQGLEIAEPYFAEGCIILVDDTNWPDPRQATLDFMANHPGEYRLLTDVSTYSNRHPTFWNGLMVLQKVKKS